MRIGGKQKAPPLPPLGPNSTGSAQLSLKEAAYPSLSHLLPPRPFGALALKRRRQPGLPSQPAPLQRTFPRIPITNSRPLRSPLSSFPSTRRRGGGRLRLPGSPPAPERGSPSSPRSPLAVRPRRVSPRPRRPPAPLGGGGGS